MYVQVQIFVLEGAGDDRDHNGSLRQLCDRDFFSGQNKLDVNFLAYI